jgi:hypothetical protein
LGTVITVKYNFVKPEVLKDSVIYLLSPLNASLIYRSNLAPLWKFTFCVTTREHKRLKLPSLRHWYKEQVTVFALTSITNITTTCWGMFDSRQWKFIFFLSTASRPALEPAQPLIQWLPGVPCPAKSGRGVKLTTHLYLLSRSRMVQQYLHS